MKGDPSMNGTLYGVGVGPGDPELLTLKAVRILSETAWLAIPGVGKESCAAYQIAVQAVPRIQDKPCLYIQMPMTKDEARLQASHEAGCAQIEDVLSKGESVCFLTLGDPAIYSTYLYLKKLASSHGYPTEIISGIPSFCAAAAALNIGLVERAEPMVIIPGAYPTEDVLDFPGTKVLMKSGKQLAKVRDQLKHRSLTAAMVENCGLSTEKIYPALKDIPDSAGYLSLIVAKPGEDGR